MAENNNNRLSRKDRHSQEKKSIMPGGYISRRNTNPTNKGQQRRPLINDEILKRGEAGANRRREGLPNVEKDSSGNGSGGPRKPKLSGRRISNPNSKKNNKTLWLKILRYGLYVASVAIISIFLLCVFWIYQAPAFDSKILDNNSRTIVYDVNNNEVAKLGNQIGENLETADIP